MGFLNLSNAHRLKKGTVLYQSTWLLHCSDVLICRSCSMKYLAEAKHTHPLSSGWEKKCTFPPSSGSRNELGITVNNTWERAFVPFNSSSLISLNECLLTCFPKHISGVHQASGITVCTDSARGVTRSSPHIPLHAMDICQSEDCSLTWCEPIPVSPLHAWLEIIAASLQI